MASPVRNDSTNRNNATATEHDQARSQDRACIASNKNLADHKGRHYRDGPTIKVGTTENGRP